MGNRKTILYGSLFLVFISVCNCNAADLEQIMNEKVERENYFKQNYPGGAQIAELSYIINGKELLIRKRSGTDTYQTLEGNIILEMGTKVTSTVINWTNRIDKYMTSQTLTIIDSQNKYTPITLDPSARSYTDKTVYEGVMRGDGYIFGRSYNLKIQGGLDCGGNNSTVNIRFELKQYWGCSSKPTLTDADINDMNQELIGGDMNSIAVPPVRPLRTYKNLYARQIRPSCT